MALGDRANRPGGRAAGNIGHIQAEPGQPVLLADRLTAATSPLAAFAGLSAGLLVLKMTRQRIHGRLQAGANATLMLTPQAPGTGMVAAPTHRAPVVIRSSASDDPCWYGERGRADPSPGLLRDATAIYQYAAARGNGSASRPWPGSCGSLRNTVSKITRRRG